MDGYDRLMLCSPLFAVGFLFPQVLCFIQDFTCHLLRDRGFKCRLLNVV